MASAQAVGNRNAAGVRPGSKLWRVAEILGVEPEALRRAIVEVCKPTRNGGEGSPICTLTVRIGKSE